MEKYKIFTLEAPPRIVIELPNTVWNGKNEEPSIKPEGIIKNIRSGQFQDEPTKIARVVLDLTKQTEYKTEKISNTLIITLLDNKTATKVENKTEIPKEKNTTPTISGKLTGETKAAMPPVTTVQTSKKGEEQPKVKKSKDLLASLPKERISVTFEEADIRDILKVLAEMGEINIVYTPTISGTFSIQLEQVPFDEAFNTVLTMNGLVAQQMGENILRVMTPTELTLTRSQAVTSYKTFTINYANASELIPHLETISPQGKISVDKKTNSIVIKDTKEGLDNAERLIASLDKKPQQVMIQAKIVEITLSNSLDLGVQWEYGNKKYAADNASVDFSGIRDDDSTIPLVKKGEAGVPLGAAIVSARPASARGTGVTLPGNNTSAGITFGFANNTDYLAATLYALAQKGDAKILSEPKVVTISNQQAKIQVGTDIPFSITTISNGVVTQSFQMVSAGILLTVTPTINADDNIRIKIKPEVSIPGNVTAAGPEIRTRNAETEVIVKSGETLVIGGLIDEQDRKSISKVPLLGDIPVLGAFFRSTSTGKNRTELLIFVTPNIVRD